VGELVDFHHDIPAQLDDAVNRVQEQMHVPFSAQQLLGIRAAFQNHVSIVTGKPGTGKSTLVKGLIQTCERLGIKYVLAAPTGRAAKRLAEVTERESQTIHRLLEFDPTTYSFRRNETNPIDADMIILDEGSMLELTLAAAAFKAIPDTASLVIIGDIDQLPAVGPGMVLKDLISCGVINVTCLNTIFRQAEGSRIITNAHRISQGLLPQFPEAKGIESDSYLMKVPRTYDSEKDKSVDNIDWVKNTLVKVCRDHIPNKMHVDPIRDIQVLVPMKVGDAGTRALNQVLQKALNPEGLSFDVRGGTFRVGDRVMQFTNDYELGVFNGDIGFIKEWDEDADELVIDFYGKDVRYPASETNSLQLAYAQTIHKSQGGEFKIVIIVMVSQHYVMLERNLIYTANTRAKELCLYIASEWAVKRAVENAQVHARNSFLAARVRGAAQLEVTV
jgi:exodeoxyribonuclease V alpha subunit